MINLIFAILSSALVSIMMRVSEEHVKNNISLLAVNYITSLIAACFIQVYRIVSDHIH